MAFRHIAPWRIESDIRIYPIDTRQSRTGRFAYNGQERLNHVLLEVGQTYPPMPIQHFAEQEIPIMTIIHNINMSYTNGRMRANSSIRRFMLKPLILTFMLASPTTALAQDQGKYKIVDGASVATKPEAVIVADEAGVDKLQITQNGADPKTLYESEFSGGHNKMVGAFATIVPSTETTLQNSTLSSYIVSNRSQPSNGGDVAGFFYAVSKANNSALFPINTIAADDGTKTGQTLTNEIDFNVNAADTDVNGLNLVIVGNTALAGDRNAIIVQGAFHPESKWSNGLVTADGAIDLYAAFIGSQNSIASTNRDSQSIGFVSYNNTNTRYISTIRGDFTGGLVLRPGSTSGSVVMQNSVGSANLAFVNTAAFTMGVPVVLPAYTVATLPACVAGLTGAMVYVTDALAPTYNGALVGGGTVKVPAACDGTAWSSH